MSIPVFFGLLTFAPAVAALIIAAMGLAHRPIARVVGVLTVLGALIPLAALLYLVIDLSSGMPLRLTLFGPSGPATWLSLAYRSDAFAVYGAFGVAVVVVPLLLWMVWRSMSGSPLRTEEGVIPPDAEAMDEEPLPEEPEAEGHPELRPARRDWQSELLPLEQWAGYALVLGLEAAALVLCFADSLVWFAIAWIVLAVLAWGVGELGAEPGDLDRLSLILMGLGPLLWLIAMLPLAAPIGASRMSDLAGVGGESVWFVLLVCLFLALAGGAYPFNGWVRRRAIFTPPVGFAAVVLALLPAALFAGGRTYATLQTSAPTPDAANLWPQLGAAVPPITIGIVLVLLGALTVAISGMIALAYRDGRTLVALLATAQVGWGLLALGIGRPLSTAALVALLATTVLGLGALVASLFVGGMLTRGEEPDGTGPRAFGAPLQPLNLLAWTLGSLALVGAPLFGGFIARHLTSAAALSAAQLTVPLTGLAWVGDALLAIALVRATVPAWLAPAKEAMAPELATADEMGREAALGAEMAGAPPTEAAAVGTATAAAVARAEELADAAQEDALEVEQAEQGEEPGETEGVGDEEEFEEEEVEPGRYRPSWGERLRSVQPVELIGLALAVLALIIGIVPQWLFLLGGQDAAQSLLQPGTLAPTFQVTTLGYVAGASQWLPSLAWIAVAILVVLAALVAEIARPSPRVPSPARSPEVSAEAVPVPAGAAALTPVGPAALASMSEPAAVWKDLAGAIDSGWTVPGINWLLSDLEEEEVAEPEGEEGLAEPSEADEGLDDMEDMDEDDEEDDGGGGPGQNPRPAGLRGEGTNEQP